MRQRPRGRRNARAPLTPRARLLLLRLSVTQSVIGLAAFWVVLGGLVGAAGFNYVNSKGPRE